MTRISPDSNTFPWFQWVGVMRCLLYVTSCKAIWSRSVTLAIAPPTVYHWINRYDSLSHTFPASHCRVLKCSSTVHLAFTLRFRVFGMRCLLTKWTNSGSSYCKGSLSSRTVLAWSSHDSTWQSVYSNKFHFHKLLHSKWVKPIISIIFVNLLIISQSHNYSTK